MTILTPSATTSTTLASVWKKFQAKVLDGVNYDVPEFRLIQDMKDGKYLPTTREVLRPLCIKQGFGIGAVAEGGARAVPGSSAPIDLTMSLNHYQGQFAVPRRVMLIAENGGSDAQIMSQLKYQARDKYRAMIRYLGDSVYLPSTAIRATTNTDLSSGTNTLTLTNGLNQSWITDGGYISRLFEVSDRIGVLLTGTLVTGATGGITSKTTTPTLVVVWDGSPSETSNGLQIVLSNTLDNTVTDYQKGLAANLVDIFTATSVHGVSSSTYPETAAGFTDTTGGRLTGARLMAGQDAIDQYSPYAADTCILDLGVHRDMVSQYQSQLRFESPYKMDVDGSIGMQSIEFFKTKRVPPGFAALFAKDSWEKFFGRPDVSDFADIEWGDLRPSETYDFMYGCVDWVGNTCVNSRQAWAFWRGLTTA